MRSSEALFLRICLTITTTVPTKNGNTNVPKRYRSDADPAIPVPTIPANRLVKTNSVDPIPAGDGITAASMYLWQGQCRITLKPDTFKKKIRYSVPETAFQQAKKDHLCGNFFVFHQMVRSILKHHALPFDLFCHYFKFSMKFLICEVKQPADQMMKPVRTAE